MRFSYLIPIFVLIISISGCTKLSKALALRKLGANQEMQDLYVRELDKKFEKMLEVNKTGGLDTYSDKTQLEQEFGNPVIARDQVYKGTPVEAWLYRYHTRPFGSDKIYFYIDYKDQIIDYKFVKAIPKKDRKYNIFGIFKKDDE